MIDRDALFHDNQQWARAIARKIAKKLPPSFDPEDLEQEALIELWKRSLEYDPLRHLGVPFKGYAYIYVRSAVLMKCRRKHYTAATGEEITENLAGHTPGSDIEIENRRERARCERLTEQRLDLIDHELNNFPRDSVVDAFLVRRFYLDSVDKATLTVLVDKPERDVSARLRRGVLRLKKCVHSGSPVEAVKEGFSHDRSERAARHSGIRPVSGLAVP